MWVLFLLFFSSAVFGEGSAEARIRAAMQASLERQKEAVRRQAGLVQAAAQSFFTVPWPAHAAVANRPTLACDPIAESELAELITNAAATERLNPALLREVIRRESAGRPCAVSPKGAQGLMQLMPATQEQFGVEDPFDPKQNVDAGARLLKQLVDRYAGDLHLALGAYNAGPGRVDREGKVPEIAETKAYVYSILRALNGL